jgi:hypothetical protein
MVLVGLSAPAEIKPNTLYPMGAYHGEVIICCSFWIQTFLSYRVTQLYP